jgi:hypothetical protein
MKQKLLIAGFFIILISASFLSAAHPIFTINSPVDNQIYNSKKIVLNLISEENLSFYYKYNNDGRWRKITYNVKSINKSINFEEGINDITIKAVNKNKSSTEIPIIFNIDSKKPRIEKIKIDCFRRYFMEFNEANPFSLTFNFGNNLTGFRFYAFDIANNCRNLKEKYICNFNITSEEYLNFISPYNNQKIEYWFELMDIVNNSFKSNAENFYADITPPEINEISYEIEKKLVYFKIEVDEHNFKQVSYMDNSAKKPKYMNLCSSLKNGICTKKINLEYGNHSINITAFDKSGNSDSKIVEILV